MQERRGCQVRAGRFTGDHHRQVAVPGQTVAQEPARGGQTIVQHTAQRRPAKEPIVYGDDGHLAGGDHGRVQPIVHRGVSDRPATSVDVEHQAVDRSDRAQDAHRNCQTIRGGGPFFHPAPTPGDPVSTADLRNPHQGLNQPRREPVAETKTGCPGKGSVEPSGLRQIVFVEDDRFQMDQICGSGHIPSENGLLGSAKAIGR